MSAVGIRLEMLHRLEQDEVKQASVAQLQETVRQAVERLRQLMFELRPPALDREGLVAAVRMYLERTREETGLNYALENQLLAEPPEDARLSLYRIVQEAVTNVRKHAEATCVTVSLDEREGGTSVRVTDDGIGFIMTGDSSPPGHLGLSAMREQAERAGGRCTVRSEPGMGTSVEAWIPVRVEEVARG
jgi:signal transduction histidine kinase